MEGRMVSDLGVTTLLSLVTNRKFAPPVLFYLGSGGRIQIHVFIESFFVGVYDRIQAHGVIQARFYVSGAVGRRAVIITDADRDGFCPAFEIWSYRRCKYAELIFFGRLYADHCVEPNM